jgi:uncharacterized membrane protein YhiD involved in acid resistance
MAFGSGFFVHGAVGTVLATAVLFGLERAEARIALWRTVATFELEMSPGVDATDLVQRATKDVGARAKHWSVSRAPDHVAVRLTAVGPARRLEQLERTLFQLGAVRAIKRV